GGRPELEPPAGVLQAPAEVSVLGRSQPLVETADLLEGRSPDQQVGRYRAGQVRMSEMRALAQEAARGAVAGSHRGAVRGGADLAGQRSDLGVRRRGAVTVEQVGRRLA